MTLYDLHAGGTLSALPASVSGTVVTVGNFDGVHLGHQALFEACRRLRDGIPGALCTVFTFTAHTRSTALLTTPDARLALFGRCGMDLCAAEDFDAVRDLSCEAFVRDVLIGSLRCAAVVCGENFRFGRNGEGDAAVLRSLAEKFGLACAVVRAYEPDGEAVSSTRIRGYLTDGDPASAARCLGRPFSFSSPVIGGRQLARTFGVPTINQQLPPHLLCPRHGVYLTRCALDDGTGLGYGVTNVGCRPTFGDGGVVCETHLLSYAADLYGKTVEVSFLAFLRDEQRFESADDLCRAIALDLDRARSMISDAE